MNSHDSSDRSSATGQCARRAQFSLKALLASITLLAFLCALITWGAIGGFVLFCSGSVLAVVGVAAAVASWRVPQASEFTLALVLVGGGIMLVAIGTAVLLLGANWPID